MNPSLYANNTLENFWRPLRPVSKEVWDEAALRESRLLPIESEAAETVADADALVERTLDESFFGPTRYEFSPLKSIYYAVARPILPNWFRPLLRKVWVRQPNAAPQTGLNWPIEDRYVKFQFATIARVMQRLGLNTLDIRGLWPDDKRFAFVLTHDVESRKGHDYVRELIALEEQYGFRSSFNFVPEGYKVDRDLLEELTERGFEVGVHGLKHDGRLFTSRQIFEQRAVQINRYLSEWRAVGYRSPMTHRNPEWMQALDIEYDLSFFDTDPYEPMPGGVMSIWPFFIGRFVELPYTLMQDHTYLEVMGHRSADVWLEKIAFLKQYHGLVLLNSHPDYLMKPGQLAPYEELLAAMSREKDQWRALPKEAAAWWRRRIDYRPKSDQSQQVEEPFKASVWRLQRTGSGVTTTVLGPKSYAVQPA